MKKYLVLSMLAVAAAGTFQSCNDRNNDVVETQQAPSATARDITGSFNSVNNFAFSQGISIPSSYVVLVYRNTSGTSSAVWQQVPYTEYLSDNRQLDYNFRFNTQQVEITTAANFNQNDMKPAEKTQYLNNQTFRIVLVPAAAGKNSLDYSDYYKVAEYYGIKESDVKK